MTGSTKVFVTGTLYWSKIVGQQALVDNYERTGKEWTFELEPDDTSFLKTHKLLDRLKEVEGRRPFIRLRKPEFDREDNPNKPFAIYDGDNQPWDDRLIGNGSRADVKLDIRDWGVGKKKSIYAAAIRVTELVEYERNPFAGMDEAAPEAAPRPARKLPGKTVVEELDSLDDELPFD